MIFTQERQNGIAGVETDFAFPYGGLIAIMALILLGPFISYWLAYAACLLCLYRVVKYNSCVFGVDYCALATVSLAFRSSGGVSLLSCLSIAAAVWYFVTGKFKVDSAVVLLILLLDFLLVRMHGQIHNFILCFSQLFLLLILLSNQSMQSILCTIKVFCISLVGSSFYSLLFRGTAQIQLLRGAEVPAYWGSSSMRFQGLFEDPNYYMALLIVAIGLVIKLWSGHWVGNGFLIGIAGSCAFFGLLTYSKTFLLIFSVLVLFYIALQFVNKHYFFGIVLVLLAFLFVFVGLLNPDSSLSIILHRFLTSTSIDDLTTGRSEIFAKYSAAIMESLSSIILGLGMDAPVLGRNTHNLFLEITYNLGFLGLILFVGYFLALISRIRSQFQNLEVQSFLYKYIVVLALTVLFFTLHGMYSAMTYAMVFLALLSTVLLRERGKTNV